MPIEMGMYKKLSLLSMLRGRSHVQQVIFLNITVKKGSKVVLLVRGVASHCCGPGSIPGPGVTCGLRLLPPQKLTFQIPILPGNSGQRKTTLWID